MALLGTVTVVGVAQAQALELLARLAVHGFDPVPEPWEADVVVLGPEAGEVPPGDRAGLVLLLDGREPGPAVRAALERAGLDLGPGVHGSHELAAADPDGPDLLAWVTEPRASVSVTLHVRGAARPAVHLRGEPGRPGPLVVALHEDAAGRVAALPVDALGADPQLLRNAVAWAARREPRESATLGAPELVQHPAWLALKEAVGRLQALQGPDGAVVAEHELAARLVEEIGVHVAELAGFFPHDEEYLVTLGKDLERWREQGLGVPDFYDSLVAFHPERNRVDGLRHLVLFPMCTQNGRAERKMDAVLVEVVWPDFVAGLEAGAYSNKLFVPIRFLDFTSGYDTNSAVLFPETVAMRAVPTFTWGAIFADREAARFRKVVRAAAQTVRLPLPPDAERLLDDQQLAEHTFVMWDLIHDRTHMSGDLPFDPFMIKQRMPYFLYGLEELRCDLTAFRESVALEEQGVPHARLVQYAVIFDRVFRFAVTGARVRNYDGLAGQLLFAWLHQRRVVHWTDNRLSIDWPAVPEAVMALGREIEELYRRSIDRPKISHWLAAYELVSSTLTPHPASVWAKGPEALPVDGPLKGLTDAVLPDEFPLSMFHEALARKIGDVVASTSGITG